MVRKKSSFVLFSLLLVISLGFFGCDMRGSMNPNTAPTAVISTSTTGTVDSVITLDGTGSYDDDTGDTITTYAWTLSGPTGSTAAIANSFAATTTFTPDVVGDYTVGLVVNDGELDSILASITIDISEQETYAGFIGITSPQDGDTVSGIITISGNYSGDIDEVKYSIDSGTEALIPMSGGNWVFNLDTTGLADGIHTITVIGLYSGSSEQLDSQPVDIIIDNGGIATINISGTITLPSGPTSGTIYVGLLNSIFGGTIPVYIYGLKITYIGTSINYEFIHVEPGEYFVGAYVDVDEDEFYDENEPSGAYPSAETGPYLISFTANTFNADFDVDYMYMMDMTPGIEIYSLSGGSIITDTAIPLTVEGEAWNNEGVFDHVDVWIEDKFGTSEITTVTISTFISEQWSVDLDLSILTDGEYTIIARAFNVSGLNSTDTMSFFVDTTGENGSLDIMMY